MTSDAAMILACHEHLDELYVPRNDWGGNPVSLDRRVAHLVALAVELANELGDRSDETYVTH